MTSTPKTIAALAAVLKGDTCAQCAAPHHQRHFDECPNHPCNNGTCTGPCWACNPPERTTTCD